MRVALVSDIHGNLPALEAVLARIQELKPDKTLCLGDTVGYGPFPDECVSIVREKCAVVLQGNHDSGLIGETDLADFNRYGVQAILWSRDKLSKENLEFLHTLPLSSEFNGFTIAHSSPLKPERWTYVMSVASAKENFTGFKTRLCFIGHTHVPVVIGEDLRVNQYNPTGRFIINVGSVGQPRDGNHMAAFGLYDSDRNTYELVRVEYNNAKTAAAIKDAGLPDFLGKRLLQGI